MQTLFLEKKTKLLKFIYNKRLKLVKQNTDLINNRFPKWALGNLFFDSDIFKYLEVDYFTLSVFVLKEPISNFDFDSTL